MNRKVLFGALIGLFLLAPSLQAQDDIADEDNGPAFDNSKTGERMKAVFEDFK